VGSDSRAVHLGVVGAGTDAYGLVIKGVVQSNGVYDGVSSTGIQLGGLGAAVNIDNGVRVTGNVTAAAVKITPQLGASTSTRNLPWGNTLKVTAKVIDPKTGQVAKGTVRLQGWSAGSGGWKTWDTKTVSGSAVTLTAKPTATAWVRTVFSGSGYNEKVTTKVKVSVKASGAKVLAEAKKHKGALYKFAAAGPKRFDCSGYTKYVYKKATGKSLPHKANSQQRAGKAVAKSNKQVGDLIVFRSGSYGSHVGIYAGAGYVYDSPHTGARVGKHKIWNNNYVVRRLVA
jgi:cell wall-associated NlpC family hydrolase